MKRLWLSVLILLVPVVAHAAETAVLPSPITLEQALKLADDQPPELLETLQQRAAARAQQLAAASQKALRVSMNGRGGRYQYDPSDHTFYELTLSAEKLIWDGGESTALEESARQRAQALKVLEPYARARYRLRVIRAFYDILLADLEYRALNEEMAVRYVTLDRIRDRHQLGTASDVELATLEKDYQQLLMRRNRAQLLQRQRRIELAVLLNRPDAVIDEVAVPKPPALPAQLSDVSEMLQQVEQRNPALLALDRQLEALRTKQRWAWASRKPKVRLQAYGGPRHYENEIDRDRWRVQLALDWPLVDGGIGEQRLAEVRAQMLSLQRKKKALRRQLQQRTAELWQVLSNLKNRNQWLKAYEAFVDLNMEYKRGLYENEERTDIGNAMIEQSRYDLERLKMAMDAALSWYELKVLQGEQIP